MNNFRTLLLLILLVPAISLAGHGSGDNISSIDGDGNGVFNGTLVHVSGSGADHPWYTFCATSGVDVTINLDSPAYSSYIWVYDVLDNNAQVGDAINVDYSLVDDAGGSTSNSLTFSPASSGQFIIQVDSYTGSDGDYTLTVSGACSTNSLEAKSIPTLSSWSLIAMLALILAFGTVTLRRQN